MLFQISSVAPSATLADVLTCKFEDLLEMITCLRVFKLPNFEARGKLALRFWWYINPHVADKKLMLQSYFLARDHFYICDKFAHGPTQKDEVYLRDYVSRLVRDEMSVMFLETYSPEAGQMLGRTLGFSHPQHLVPTCHSPSHHALPCIQCLHGLHGRSNLHTVTLKIYICTNTTPRCLGKMVGKSVKKANEIRAYIKTRGLLGRGSKEVYMLTYIERQN